MCIAAINTVHMNICWLSHQVTSNTGAAVWLWGQGLFPRAFYYFEVLWGGGQVEKGQAGNTVTAYYVGGNMVHGLLMLK